MTSQSNQSPKEVIRCPKCDSADVVRVPKNGWDRFLSKFGELKAMNCKACLHHFVKPLE